MTTDEMLKRYCVSYFEANSLPRTLTAADRRQAETEYEADPAAAMLKNIEHAQFDLKATTERFFAARDAGLFDPDCYTAQARTPRQKADWITAADVLRGDYHRARGELAHWREYLGWARAGRPTPAGTVAGRGRDVARSLAEAKSTDHWSEA